MGFMDAFTTDAPVTIKHAEYYELVKEAAKAELIMNAVNCNVPHKYIRETMTGKEEPDIKVITPRITPEVLREIANTHRKKETPDCWSCDTCQHKSEPITAEQILDGCPCDECEDGSNYQAKESEGK